MIRILSLAAMSVVTIGSVAHAATVTVGAVTASVSVEDSAPYNDLTRISDQSGLSQTYVNGVTDFDLFTTNTTATNESGVLGKDNFGLAGVSELGSFYFDLGARSDVSGIATWGQDLGFSVVTGYDLYSSDTFGASGSRSLVGSFTSGLSPTAFVGNFSTVTSQFFEIDVTANGGSSRASRFQEVVFGVEVPDVAPVPVPASMPLILGGMGVLALFRRRND